MWRSRHCRLQGVVSRHRRQDGVRSVSPATGSRQAEDFGSSQPGFQDGLDCSENIRFFLEFGGCEHILWRNAWSLQCLLPVPGFRRWRKACDRAQALIAVSARAFPRRRSERKISTDCNHLQKPDQIAHESLDPARWRSWGRAGQAEASVRGQASYARDMPRARPPPARGPALARIAARQGRRISVSVVRSFACPDRGVGHGQGRAD